MRILKIFILEIDLMIDPQLSQIRCRTTSPSRDPLLGPAGTQGSGHYTTH